MPFIFLYKSKFFNSKFFSFLSSDSFVNFLIHLLAIFITIGLCSVYVLFFQPPLYTIDTITYVDLNGLVSDLRRDDLGIGMI